MNYFSSESSCSIWMQESKKRRKVTTINILFLIPILTVWYHRLCRPDSRGVWQLPPASSSCLVYVNGPAASLGLVLVSSIMGITAVSGEQEIRMWHRTLISSIRHNHGCWRSGLCWPECPGSPVPANSLQEKKQVLRCDHIQRWQALSQKMLAIVCARCASFIIERIVYVYKNYNTTMSSSVKST